MPRSCCAVGCTNRQVGEKKHVPFYKMPKGSTPFERRRREDWIRAIRCDDWKTWSPDKISKAFICGEHFIAGKRSDDPEEPNWIPTIFTYTTAKDISKVEKKMQSKAKYELLKNKRGKLKKNWNIREDENGTVEDMHNVNDTPENDGIEDPSATHREFGTQYESGCDEVKLLKERVSQLDKELRERNNEVYRLREEISTLKRSAFGFSSLRKSQELIQFFTGLPTVAVFLWVVSLVKRDVKKCCQTISAEDHALIVLMKLRLGLLNRDIAHRYGCKDTMISKIYRRWLPALASSLKSLIIWPSRDDVRANLPQSFKRKYRDCICIIDCSEIFIERPKNLTARAQTWSNYKHNNTIKYLIGISPAGAVTFLSEGWGGRVSDKQITLESGFIWKVYPGDCILADRGFLIDEDLAQRGAFLKIPKFTKGKSQLAAKDVHRSRQLANVRIHVERVIGQLKKFRILQSTIPISQVDLIDNVMVVISAIVNLNRSIVN
eukprot:Seg253.27 transcript_id=Seg253.27/GoldUCD/mRNA.D3Y31 product="THAP domain-containing protein 4" protein_id=Seg253.27/GoldUCD/D3Y31